MSRYPIKGVVGTPFGVFRQADGKWHWGVDIAAQPGTQVVAPEAMEVVRVWSDESPPFAGYGPGGVLARAVALPQRYHLLAHLAPSGALVSAGDVVAEGAGVGEVSSLAHVHWEMRREAIDSPESRPRNTFDPVVWVRTGQLVERSRGAGVFLVLLALWLISRR